MTFSPAFLLLRPQLGENIGAAARVMMNFGFTDLRIVAPRDGWPNPAAESMAAGGLSVLQGATLYDTAREAVADLNRVYATTARPREMEKEVISPYDFPAHTGDITNSKIGVLFGPERSGMDNEEIALADTIITVPVNPDYPSLNLAQTVALVAYECARLQQLPLAGADVGAEHAPKEELHGLFDHLEAELDRGNFWKVAEKKPQMWINIRNFFTRAQLSSQEVRTLRGMIRCLSER